MKSKYVRVHCSPPQVARMRTKNLKDLERDRPAVTERKRGRKEWRGRERENTKGTAFIETS